LNQKIALPETLMCVISIKKAIIADRRVNLLLFIICHPKWWLPPNLVVIFFQPDLAFRLAGYTAGRESHPASKTVLY